MISWVWQLLFFFISFYFSFHFLLIDSYTDFHWEHYGGSVKCILYYENCLWIINYHGRYHKSCNRRYHKFIISNITLPSFRKPSCLFQSLDNCSWQLRSLSDVMKPMWFSIEFISIDIEIVVIVSPFWGLLPPHSLWPTLFLNGNLPNSLEKDIWICIIFSLTYPYSVFSMFFLWTYKYIFSFNLR